MNNIYPSFQTIKNLKISTLLLIISVFSLTSCSVNKSTVYLNNLSDSVNFQSIPLAKFKEPVIQVDDILAITIQTIGPSATATNIQAQPGNSTLASSNQPQSTGGGYLVDNNGEVQLPMIGKLKLSGLTTKLARELIVEKSAFYLKDPVVQVRFSNYKITVLGEVRNPATYTVPSEKISIIDLLGMAGDLTIYGRRDNILVLRDNGEKKDVIRLNLASSDIVNSPYYYLKQNDIVYVEPNKARLSVNNAANLQILKTAITVISFGILLFIRLN